MISCACVCVKRKLTKTGIERKIMKASTERKITKTGIEAKRVLKER